MIQVLDARLREGHRHRIPIQCTADRPSLEKARRNVQAVIAIPGLATLRKYGDATEALMQRVGGVPLLVRIIRTAVQANVGSILIVWPEDINPAILTSCPEFSLLAHVRVAHLLWPTAFDPRSSAQWAALARHLDDELLWMPWNWVTYTQALMALPASCVRPVTWQFPVLFDKCAVFERARSRVSTGRQTQGPTVTSLTSVTAAERFLVEHSGKSTDGINGQFNQRICAPLVELLSHTRLTSNAINVAGLLLAILAAFAFTRGTYLNYVAGAVLFFLSALCDETDRMLSRLKFRERGSHAWLQVFAGNVAYLSVFAGIVIGLHRQYGAWALKYGIPLIVGGILSMVVINRRRRFVTILRNKGVLAQGLLLFAVFGALPLFLYLAAIGSNLAWILALYFARRSFPTPPLQPAAPGSPNSGPAHATSQHDRYCDRQLRANSMAAMAA